MLVGLGALLSLQLAGFVPAAPACVPTLAEWDRRGATLADWDRGALPSTDAELPWCAAEPAVAVSAKSFLDTSEAENPWPGTLSHPKAPPPRPEIENPWPRVPQKPGAAKVRIAVAADVDEPWRAKAPVAHRAARPSGESEAEDPWRTCALRERW